MDKLSSKIIYGLAAGLVYATTLALMDYFRDKDFDLISFISGTIIFGLVMIIAAKLNKKEKE